MKMSLFAAVILLWTGLMVNSERHSLYYIYTSLSKSFGLPGIHKFSAMGVLDGRMIDYYDSEHQEKVPKENWMKERMDPDYWVEGTKSRQSKENWFNTNMKILMDRMHQDNSSVHVLQWIHGCVGETQANVHLAFRSAVDAYSYDGYDFLSFHFAHAIWVAGSEAAALTKRKWDGVRVLREYTQGYLENECIDWLSKFVTYSETQLETESPPQVFLFPKNTNKKNKITLTCLVTGFYSKDITLNIKRNGRVLSKEDGVFTFGVRPNDEETFQRRDYVELLSSDTANYTCEVIRRGLHLEKRWDREPVPDKLGFVAHGLVIAGVFVGLIAMVTVLVLVYTKRVCVRSVTNESRGDTVSVSGGVVHGSVADTIGSNGPLSGCSLHAPTDVTSFSPQSQGLLYRMERV